MRQGQQNRRGRGRGRKVQNPLARNFESNGPDVKIRGTAAHIAEKYTTLARDAAASGDNVMAENYLQHAEHYIRIIMAAQVQQMQNQPHQQGGEGVNGAMGQHRQNRRPHEGGMRPQGDAFGGIDDGEEMTDQAPRQEDTNPTDVQAAQQEQPDRRRRGNGSDEAQAEPKPASEDNPDSAVV